MFSRLLIVVSSLLVTACAGSGGSVGQTSAARATPAEAIDIGQLDNGQICERRSVTGSNIVQRICYSREEYEATQSLEQRALIDEINESSQREINQSMMREAARSGR